jgi:hypothetical protein
VRALGDLYTLTRRNCRMGPRVARRLDSDQREDRCRSSSQRLVSASGSDFAEVAVVFVDPVLAGWGEDVEVDGVFESGGGVGEVPGDDENLACFDGVRGPVVVVEAECSFGDEGDLLVGMGVTRDDAAFGEDNAGEHGQGAGDELACEKGIELLGFYFVPAMESCGRHGESLSRSGDCRVRLAV